MENITSQDASLFWAMVGPIIMTAVAIVIALIALIAFAIVSFKRDKREQLSKAVASDAPVVNDEPAGTADEAVDDIDEVQVQSAKEIDPKVIQYARKQLDLAKQQAAENVAVGDAFEFELTNLPAGVSAIECYAPMWHFAADYGLKLGAMRNNRSTFTRIK